jgi:hypothetical protein
MTLPETLRTLIGDGTIFDDPGTINRVNPMDAVGWDPLETFASLHVREPLSEGVRQLLLTGVRETGLRMNEMERWLLALDLALDDAERRVLVERLQTRENRRRPRPSHPKA